jgi:primosomal protein N' (replication factor Y) (superfamily II helicase)
VRVSLLIPTHALPPLSYRVPESLCPEVRPGTVVVAPLSGRSRVGVVLGDEDDHDRAREDLFSVADGLSLPRDLMNACLGISETAAVPLPVVLRAALPPGLDVSSYRVAQPAPRWPWDPGSVVSRTALKRVLGADGLREAEAEGRVLLAPSMPRRRTEEWAEIRPAASPDLGRAPRQRELLDFVRNRGGSAKTADLLAETGAGRNILRELVRRGALRLAQRPETRPMMPGLGGSDPSMEPFSLPARRAVEAGGAFVWRTPTGEQAAAVTALVNVIVRDGEQALVLVPDISGVGGVACHLGRVLPADRTVAAYHSGLRRDRAAVYEAARRGSADVVVGTRTAALLPLARPGLICIMDEPDESHRASPGYEGLPVHARDVALARGLAEGSAVICLSPTPSLRLYAPEARRRRRVRELPPREPDRWPSVRIVDMRASGASLSSVMREACRRFVDDDRRVGVVVDRLAYATAVSCNRCGTVRRCPNCDLPLALHGRREGLSCPRCGRREPADLTCRECGADRMSPTGLAVERVREELAEALGGPVGLMTAGKEDLPDLPAVVGTARRILEKPWDAVIIPDVDASLNGSGIGAVERSFRLLYRAAESAGDLLLVQTRMPEHYALRAAVRGDYEAFAAAETPRLRTIGYPPFGHLASLTLEGPEKAAFRAVESRLRPRLDPDVEMSDPVPAASPDGRPSWRVLLRSRELGPVARAAARMARLAAETHGLKARVDVDPEEV